MSQLSGSTRPGASRRADGPTIHRLFVQVYEKLHRLAAVVCRRGTAPDLDATALVHEAYLHLHPCDDLDVASEQHFLRLAARAMRQVLARDARRRRARKRGADVPTVSFHRVSVGRESPLADALAVRQALAGLRRAHPRQARVVTCRHYDGLSVAETAQALGVSTATVKRDWRAARKWLRAYLAPLS